MIDFVEHHKNELEEFKAGQKDELLREIVGIERLEEVKADLMSRHERLLTYYSEK